MKLYNFTGFLFLLIQDVYSLPESIGLNEIKSGRLSKRSSYFLPAEQKKAGIVGLDWSQLTNPIDSFFVTRKRRDSSYSPFGGKGFPTEDFMKFMKAEFNYELPDLQ